MKISTSLGVGFGLLVAFGLTIPAAHAQTAPTWDTVQRTSSPNATSYGVGRSIALAADGSRYITGEFVGPLTLGTFTLTPGAGSAHQFLAKYNAAGAVLWATQLDGGGSAYTIHVATDAAGNAYLVGTFSSAVTFSGTTLTPVGNNPDSYLAKFDPQGTMQWVRQGGSGTWATSIATDASGNVAVAGYSDTAAAFGGAPLAGSGMCYYKFSPAGTILQARRVATAQGTFTTEMALALDGAGNAYLAGGFIGTTTFGSLTLTSGGGYYYGFLCKLDATGTPVWVRRTGGANGGTANAVAVDAAGNPVVGSSTGYVDYVGSTLFVDQFTAQGSPVWSQTIGPLYTGYGSSATGISLISGVAYDGRGGCFVTGQLAGTTMVGATRLSATAGPQAFVVRYDGQGNSVWATQTLGSGSNVAVATGIAADASGLMHVVGSAVGTIAFGPLSTTAAAGRADVFVATLTPGSVLTAARPAAGLVLAAYPNPASGSVTLRLPVGGGQLAVLDAVGRTVRRQALPATAGDCPVPLTGLAPGLYQLRATLGNGQPATAPLLVR
ncbi:hypothetical protein KB206_07795 [Microvirga sp. STS02]|uniref:hypothetical protein n=1 Tax=Hymenobacter negativus TaxID=2795026 RepID=UPI0018DBEFB1|nr:MULTISPECIES: hypothetical protein [Bacteria]MBH8568779.1 hypothetical protein [Hymenobacter negativus]MBR7208513.1 hypothetical protein [Microvirga sp. STS02]